MAWYENKIVNFDHEVYKNLCDEFRKIAALEKEVAEKKEKLRDELIKQSGGERVENGVKIEQRISKGLVDYKKLLWSLNVKEDYVEKFRGSPRTAWYVTAY